MHARANGCQEVGWLLAVGTAFVRVDRDQHDVGFGASAGDLLDDRPLVARIRLGQRPRLRPFPEGISEEPQ